MISVPHYDLRWELALPAIRAVRDRVILKDAAIVERYLSGLRELDRQLRKSLLDWGEPKYELKHIQLTVCIGFSNRYRVH